VPSPADFAPGCRFSDRCPAARAICRTEAPVVLGDDVHHQIRCHFPAERVLIGAAPTMATAEGER
jgi:peptide/nickel transport system permease protein